MTTQSDISLNGGLPSTRAEARACGASHYFTGKECCNSHLSTRKTINGHCNECERQRDRRRAEHKENLRKTWREKNRERRNATEQAWRDANRDKVRGSQKEWYSQNRETVLKRRRAGYFANIHFRRQKRVQDRIAAPEKFKRWDRLWYQANPEKAKERNRNLRASRRKSEGTHTASDIQAIREMQRDCCACCRIKLKGGGHVDHIVALARGGTNWRENLQILCGPCNASKGAKDPIDFMQSRGFLL